MIGPHEGHELRLMLEGKKALAIFCDIVKDDYTSPEEFIPEQAFAPHVKSGVIKRFSHDVISRKDGKPLRFVYFTLPNEEWRAHFMMWMNEMVVSGKMKHELAYDVLTGNLLGYTESDIQSFINNKTRFLSHNPDTDRP